MSLRDLQGKGIWIPLQLPSLLIPSDKPMHCVAGNTVLVVAQSPYYDNQLMPHLCLPDSALAPHRVLVFCHRFFLYRRLALYRASVLSPGWISIQSFHGAWFVDIQTTLWSLSSPLCMWSDEVGRNEQHSQGKGKGKYSKICFCPRLLMLLGFFSKGSVLSCGLLVWDFGKFGRFLEW